ncbi:hypothetical protein BC829DRAFT_489533 [Chytridium lagenaria]|nr:hypothetical protein BC829DRAFT_489533 [Chytridium lagenaria]
MSFISKVISTAEQPLPFQDAIPDDASPSQFHAQSSNSNDIMEVFRMNKEELEGFLRVGDEAVKEGMRVSKEVLETVEKVQGEVRGVGLERRLKEVEEMKVERHRREMWVLSSLERICEDLESVQCDRVGEMIEKTWGADDSLRGRIEHAWEDAVGMVGAAGGKEAFTLRIKKKVAVPGSMTKYITPSGLLSTLLMIPSTPLRPSSPIKETTYPTLLEWTLMPIVRALQRCVFMPLLGGAKQRRRLTVMMEEGTVVVTMRHDVTPPSSVGDLEAFPELREVVEVLRVVVEGFHEGREEVRGRVLRVFCGMWREVMGMVCGYVGGRIPDGEGYKEFEEECLRVWFGGGMVRRFCGEMGVGFVEKRCWSVLEKARKACLKEDFATRRSLGVGGEDTLDVFPILERYEVGDGEGIVRRLWDESVTREEVDEMLEPF